MKVRKNNAYQIGLTGDKNTGKIILAVIKIFDRFFNFILCFRWKKLRMVKIPGNSSKGNTAFLCNICNFDFIHNKTSHY